MKTNHSEIPNMEIYNTGLEKGVSLSGNSEKPDMLKHNPYSAYLEPGAYLSYALGFRAGVRIGMEQVRYNRTRQLEKIQSQKEPTRER
ncbi:MAG: hypothetical protein R2764_08315 [Bacteroidales bacterium]